MSESKFKKWITLLKENPVSAKVKKIAWVHCDVFIPLPVDDV